jgi:hypothetical protein
VIRRIGGHVLLERTKMSEQERKDEEEQQQDAKADARELMERWQAVSDWEGQKDAPKAAAKARKAAERAEAAERKRAEAQARRQERELARAARQEQARLRRESRELKRLGADEERRQALGRLADSWADVRKSFAVFHEQGIGAVVRGAFRRRWVVALSLCILVLVSALAGALAMRARQRRYLSAVLVAVNGQTIRRSDLNDELQKLYGPATLNAMVQRELRRQFLAKHGAVATEQQVADRLKLEARMPEFLPTLQKAGKSEAEYREALKRTLSELNLVSKGVTVTEAEQRQFYKINADPNNLRALFYTPDVVTLAVICTPTRDLANRARRALDAGADFTAVARAMSVDDSAQRGGIMEPFAIGRSLNARAKGLDAVARQLNTGQQVGPIQMGGLWWLIRCIERVPAQTRPYEQVKETVRVLALAAKGEKVNGSRLAEEFEQFRKKAKVQTFLSQ